MKYGKIRIEDGNLIFIKHMMINNLPCKDILWAYMRREGIDGGEGRQVLSSCLVIITRRKKRYRFDMTEWEVQECIRILKALNPRMAVGFPRGEQIPMQSISNIRDLGAIMTSDERHILPRKLLRSGDLYHVSLADQRVLLEEYNLKKIIDFRSNAEIKEKPDTIMKGVEYYHIPIIDEVAPDSGGAGFARTKDMRDFFAGMSGSPEEFMEQQYERFLMDEYSVKQYARFMDLILHHEEGAVLWHCSAGKDRTGIAAAIVLFALGVPRKTIREDYLKSNTYLEGNLAYMRRLLESKEGVSEKVMDNLSVLFCVEEDYFNKAFHAVEKNYGSINNFLRKGMYLNTKALEEMKNKYLI